ncbi:serine dehydratase [Bradyrhizobium sp. NAS80.1]|uniref:L-serine ammonia-lyase n=1 Tax=Bradyrhizobium sp. NAS80.1 TaxID=1680159 RepID=UPI00095B910F|nr:L-serine ammonia-lyase [Bradyrhizobium sp. NAS80.1]OKO69453.1 serine dehydratase [Bradyrhizobium sp. NAS80.1]
MFVIGIGPSSSHTVGPMRAAHAFIHAIGPDIHDCTGIRIDVYGSLALTGKGHCTDRAIILGLCGWLPDTIDPASVDTIVNLVRSRSELSVIGGHTIPFAEDHLVFRTREVLPRHSNGLRFTAFRGTRTLLTRTYYSIGGGTIVSDDEAPIDDTPQQNSGRERFPFSTASELLAIGHAEGLSIADIVAANESSRHEPHETEMFLDSVRTAMMRSIDSGCVNEGILPGNLNVKRRAPDLLRKLNMSGTAGPLSALEWVSVYALAVNEENAAGGRVVTAPTNGAAGVIPAVLKYYETFFRNQATRAKAHQFLLTASAIGMLYKKNASISAAEMGCQGEVGVACSMAAAGLTAVLGGSNAQIENAAEIGMEHNLGLTCDPIGGLVQIPCIERNTMGAIKAINAAMLALRGDGNHRVSLDEVIETMRQTGRDMRTKYKETSLGGLAVNVADC